MDLDLVRERLAALGLTVEGILRADPYSPDSISEPHLYVGEMLIQYDQTFGGLMDVEFTVRVLASHADDEAGQSLLNTFVRPTGPTSVKAALEGTPGVPQTLGGACDDLHVPRMQGHRLYKVGEHVYLGAEWPVRVIGTESEE